MKSEQERKVIEAMKSIGFGRSMQLAEEMWRALLIAEGHPPGGEFASYCCVASLVPCPGCAPAREAGEHCDWCCGDGRVTKRVAESIVRA